jgi:hypothetical protein
MKSLVSLFLAVCVVLCCSASVVRAYQVTQEVMDVPYEVAAVTTDPQVEQSLLGELDGSPEMFEIVSETEFELTVEVRAVPVDTRVTPDFSGLIIRQKEKRGVEEVARLKASDALWDTLTDGTTGLRYQAGPFFSEKLPAGTYRIEVSTPENSGKYILVIGNTPVRLGYFATLGHIATTYHFYGLSKISMFSSPYIHYPIGIFVLIGLITATWYWQRKRNRHG